MEIHIQQMPAACGNCSYLYPSGYYFEPGGAGVRPSVMVLENLPVTIPCPMCGRHKSRILASEYQLVESTMKFLQAPERTTEEREGLGALLREAQERGESAEEIRDRANRGAPELSATIGKLLAYKTAGIGLATRLALLINTIGKVSAVKGYVNTAKLEPSEVIYDSVNEYNVLTVQAPSATDEERLPTAKLGRNDPCPCGSGKKFKKCHGDTTKKPKPCSILTPRYSIS